MCWQAGCKKELFSISLWSILVFLTSNRFHSAFVKQFLWRRNEMYQSPLTQAFHTYRINLSPFTKDFRVWGALIENSTIYLRLSVDSCQKTIIRHHASNWHCWLLLCKFGMSTAHSMYFSISMFPTKFGL